MRISQIFATTALTLATAVAFASAPATPARKGVPVDGASWVRVASQADVAAAKMAQAMVRPSVLVESDYPAYDPAINPEMSLYLTIGANGFEYPVSMYMYWQNRVTGEKVYFNAVDGLLTDGSVTDLFGHADPLAVYVPEVDRLQLLGPGNSAFGMAPEQPTGRYQFVLELRDMHGAVISRGNAMYNYVDETVALNANITADTTLDADNLYVLVSAIFIEDGATLTIPRGTVIFGDTGTKGTLVVAQGGKLMAEGTAMQPIIMTSPAALGTRGPQDWGGLIINGYSTLNIPGDCSEGEGDTGQYGGCGTADEMDDSGTMRYVRVEFAGIEFSPDNELNGIAFQGVGSGSTFENIQVHYNQDDGVEFFGGTAHGKRFVMTGIGDDSVDWTEGWRGKLQFLVVVQDGSIRADHGIEADNWETDNDATPRANSQIYNATFIGSGDTGSSGDDGLKLRRGTGGDFHNWIVYGFRETGLDVDDEATFIQANNGGLTLQHSIIAGNGSYTGQPNFKDDADSAVSWQGSGPWFLGSDANREIDPMLAAPFYWVRPDLTPLPGSPALDASYVASAPDDGFFEPAPYLGAIAPGFDWTEGWTIWSKN